MLRNKLDGLAHKGNLEDKAIYRVMELEIVKYNGLKSGIFTEKDEIYKTINNLIYMYLWLHQKGLTIRSRVNDVRDALDSSEDKELFAKYVEDHAKYNEFIKMHASLKGGI